MPEPSNDRATARCRCGSVELETRGAPILGTVCYCDDCQEGSRRIGQLPNAPPVLDRDGGTPYLLYRKDRMECSKGAHLLRDHRLDEESHTRRVVASCCNSAMFLDFEKGHWYSVYRARFSGAAPPIEMRVQTKFKRDGEQDPGEVPSYDRYPLKFMLKLVASRIAMMVGR